MAPVYNYGVCVPGDNSSSYPMLQTQPAPDKFSQRVSQYITALTGLRIYNYEFKPNYHFREVFKFYLKNWEEAKSVTNYPYPLAQLTDDAIHRTFEDINERFEKCINIETTLRLPSEISDIISNNETELKICKFINGSSPMIQFIPKTVLKISCTVDDNDDIAVMIQNLRKKEGFNVTSTTSTTCLMTKNNFGVFKVEFVKGKSKDIPFRRAELMQKLSGSMTAELKKIIQSWMTVVTFARFSFNVGRHNVPDLALSVFGYCVSRLYKFGNLETIVYVLSSGLKQVELNIDTLECQAKEDRGGPVSSTLVTVVGFGGKRLDQMACCWIPNQFRELIVEQYKRLQLE
eukprot:GHVS01068773.1.p1 GENE.GHVS01068773.1~~GHVS01068773.1.p1  ORF type:complete len:373 (-),score=18.62 GHVS01068773.1:80-1117(-)